MNAATRKRLWSVAKWVVTLGLLGVVLSKVPLADLARRIRGLSLLDVSLLVAVTVLQVALSATRWWRLLRSTGERVSWIATFGDLSVGIFYNFLLPGGVGGDVVRALRMRRRLAATHHAWSTSIAERAMGLFTIALLGSAAAMFGVDASFPLPGWLKWLALGVAGTLALVVVFASHPFRLLHRFVGARLPTEAAGDIQGIADDLAGPLAKLSVRAEAFAWSIVYQVASIAFTVLCASALGAPGHAWAIMIGTPLVFVLSIAPVTIGGHGLREGLYVGLLGALGVPTDVALGLSAMYVAAVLLFCGVGALFEIFDRQSPPKP